MASPSYATLPRTGEQILSSGLGSGAGSYEEKRTKRLALFLDGASGVYTYAPGALVSGRVGVLDAKDVLKLEVKLEGVLRTETANINLYMDFDGAVDDDRHTVTLVSKSIIAWDKKASSPTATTARKTCPAELPFQFRLPKTFFDDAGKEWPVPPTFEASDEGVRRFVCYVRYKVSVTVTLARTLTAFWAQNETLSTPITVRAISRPAYPAIATALPIADSFASHPDAWSVREFHLTTTGPVAVQLHLPKPTAYYMGAPIPFRLQFTGEPSALASFAPDAPAEEKGRVHASIERQTNITVQDGELLHRVTIGSCTHLEPLSLPSSLFHPTESDPSTNTDVGKKETLAWTGELFVHGEFAASLSGGFRAGPVSAVDFVVVGSSPPEARDTAGLAFVDSQRRVPIALTTEPWVDDGM